MSYKKQLKQLPPRVRAAVEKALSDPVGHPRSQINSQRKCRKLCSIKATHDYRIVVDRDDRPLWVGSHNAYDRIASGKTRL